MKRCRKRARPTDFVPQIRVTLTREPDAAVIRITDNGIGLPPDRARLFEPYVTTREKGTGLGLPIVKKIIEEHGGTLALLDAEPFRGPDPCRGHGRNQTAPQPAPARGRVAAAQAFDKRRT